MPQYAYATPSTTIGLAIETARGTLQSPAYWFKVKAPKYKPDLTWNPDETLQGSMIKVYDLVPGMRYDAHGWDSYPYLDSFPVLLRALLGSSDTVTVAPSSTTVSSNAAAGASSIATAGSIAIGSYIVIGSGGTMETHVTTSLTGTTTPYTIGLAVPLINAQASTTVVTGLTKHQLGLLNNSPSTGNQSPTVTLTDFAGDTWRWLTASTLDSIDLKGNATGIVDYSCNWFCNAAQSSTTPTATFTSAEALPGWTTAILIGGSPVLYWLDFEFDLKRGVKPVGALNYGQQYLSFFQDALMSTGKTTVLLQSNSPELAAYEAGTVQSFDFTTFDMRSGYALNLHSTKAQFNTTSGIDRSKEWVEVQLDFQLLPSSTDAVAGGVSSIVTTVANGQTGAY